MTERFLMKGNEAIAEGAVLAGCQAYFGYPITPQNELLERMARRMAETGRTFVQTESEVAAISMVLGASAAGCRTMTSTSSPGFSLQQEGISYMAGSELPGVVVNVMRGGPGLGGIMGAQQDYLQTVKGGGHGDYRVLTLAPSSVQEAMDLTILAFDLADKYRNPVVVLTDGFVGQVSEPIVMRDPSPPAPLKPWAVTGASGRKRNLIRSIHLDPDVLEAHNQHLWEKYSCMEASEVRFDSVRLEDAEVVVVAYGSVSRASQTAIDEMRARGVRAGLFRPVSLYPFPYRELAEAASRAKAVLVAELSSGQMVEDVRLAVRGEKPIFQIHRLGGNVLAPEEVQAAIAKIVSGEAVPLPVIPGAPKGCGI